jgi:hypothetical protein
MISDHPFQVRGERYVSARAERDRRSEREWRGATEVEIGGEGGRPGPWLLTITIP